MAVAIRTKGLDTLTKGVVYGVKKNTTYLM